jgi:hypothetical protein
MHDPLIDPDVRRSKLAAAERLRALSDADRDLVRLVSDPGFRRWREQIRNIGGCSRPIYLAGHTTVVDRVSGEVLHHYDSATEPGGRIPVRCNNRRHTACPSCSYLHQGDTFQLMRAGLVGGKGVPAEVRSHPRLFVTLTAPSFGAVHRATSGGGPCRPRRGGGECEHGRPIGCGQAHAEADPPVGQPLCPDCYDYTHHVLWHAHAGRLWSRWCDAVRRHLATACGIAQSKLRDHVRVSFAKVAEYQARGAVHFHAVVRLDGPDGPDIDPPVWATDEVLESAIRAAAGVVELHTPYSLALGEYVLRWGEQIDVHPIRSGLDGQALTDDAVAAYVAKYVTKSVTGGADHRIKSLAEIRHLPITDHLRSLMTTCWHLGGLAELEELRLRAWTHSLGYRGHILTKSRVYSTTYGALRDERASQAQQSAGWLVGPSTIIQSSWRYIRSGHSPAEANIAKGVANGLATLRDIRKGLESPEVWADG